jgi:hypothetical protein
MSNITAIEKIDGGWKYTFDTVPDNGWDVWLAGIRIATQFSDTSFRLYAADSRPPAIEVIDPYTETASHSASTQIQIFWQHMGARFYIIEYSPDNVTFYQVATLAGDGNIWHKFTITSSNDTGYWKVFPAALDVQGYYKTSYEIDVVVEQSYLPQPPLVSITIESSKAYIELIDFDAYSVPAGVVGNGEMITRSDIATDSELPVVEVDSALSEGTDLL